MVEDRITDGERIAELLASELTGLARPPLDRVAVVDADPDATPSADGTFAYRIALDDEELGTVALYPDHARIDLTVADLAESVLEVDDESTVVVERVEGAVAIRVESGAAVKRARDLLVRVAESMG